MAKFSDIPKLTKAANYRVNADWKFLEETLEHWADHNLNLDPDFQRGHVWTEEQQIKYVEFCLRGGQSAREILFNQAGWMIDFRGEMVLVDGKQRLQAVRRFMNNEIPVFGHYFKEYEDRIPSSYGYFIFCVNDLNTRDEVLQWYLEFNTGGTPHTQDEIDKVKEMLKKERTNKK
jgi:hypothetical protein